MSDEDAANAATVMLVCIFAMGGIFILAWCFGG